METKNFFNAELSVRFTMDELLTISSSLFDSWSNDINHGWNATADSKLELRDKLKQQIDMYYDII